MKKDLLNEKNSDISIGMNVAKRFIVDQLEKRTCLKDKENKMKKAVLLLIVMFVLVFSVFAMNKDYIEEERIGKKFAKGSRYVTGQVGINSYVATDEPFNAMPFLLGAWECLAESGPF
jgi:hypothetical protein